MSRIFQVNQKEEATSTPFAKWQEPSGEVLDLIEETRRAVAQLSENQRFNRAKIHLEQALKYKNPRIDIFNQDEGIVFKMAYALQTSFIWQLLIRTISFVYMYLIVYADGDSSWIYKIGSVLGLGLFWIDILLELLHSSRDGARKASKYSTTIYIKGIILILLLIQLILISENVQDSSGRPINPLRFLRPILPIIYVSEVRRSFQALVSAYQQFLVFVVFDFLVVVGFALIGSIIIQVPEDTVVDTFTSNYDDLGHMVFITYVTGSYDSFPDNQLLAFTISKWFQLFFIVFVFLNMFLFSSIPGSLLFDAYINTRSKYILIDEIKMQHSLILAFISLGEHNYEINIKTIISFFHYLYQDRVRYIDSITELCLKLNDDGNCSVHVLQFIQLGRVLQQNPYLKPPILPDYSVWIAFRTKFNQCIPLNRWLNYKPLPIILALFALIGFINSLICLYIDSDTVTSINRILSCLFLIDVLIRVIGEGPQNYFNGEWNTLDLILILLSFIFTFSCSTPIYSALFKVLRIYRIFPLVKESLQNSYIWVEFDLLDKFKQLLGTIIIILPLITRFLPLFIVVYYLLGLAGMQLFYDIAQAQPTIYGAYDEFSHFKQFINTQFYLVQVLTQAGWSSVAFDYAKRAESNYALILMFFVMCHVVIVLVLAAVLKGIIWFVFLTVTQLLDEQERKQKNDREKKEEMLDKVKEFNQLEINLQGSTLFKYDTVMKRILFQIKADSQILLQLHQQNHRKNVSLKRPKSMNLRLYRQFEFDRKIIQGQHNGCCKQFQNSQNNFLFTMLSGFQNTGQVKLSDLQEIQQEDIEEHMKKLVHEFKINTTRFEYQLLPNRLLQKHLLQKLVAPYLMEREAIPGDTNIQKLTDKRSLDFHVFTLHLLLDIRTDRRQQKRLVVNSLSEDGVIDQCDSRQILTSKVNEQSFRVDQDCIIRKMYLQDTNKNLIDKFEAEYFSDIFGPSFKETNKVTIEPLIRLEATLTYAIKKLMRSPQISSLQFFKILGDIQVNISNKLLKKGSLFKFVFQLNSQADTWFTVHFTALNETRISFLKHGVWLHHSKLLENQIYYAKDIFCDGKSLQKEELLPKATLMKKMFETFETLALTLCQNGDFFDSNPSYHQYDAFLTYIDVSTLERLIPKDLQISKIMVVMLTKEQERDEPLGYPISDIEVKPPVDLIDFKLDETEADTFRKLGNLCALNQEEITANEGLPFAYVLNFLCEISDILKLYAPNFVHQTESVLDQQIKKRGEEKQFKNDNIVQEL